MPPARGVGVRAGEKGRESEREGGESCADAWLRSLGAYIRPAAGLHRSVGAWRSWK